MNLIKYLRFLKNWLNMTRVFFIVLGRCCFKNSVFYKAAALSYYSILSLIPFLFVLFSFLAMFNVFGDMGQIQQSIQNFIVDNLNDSVSPKVSSVIDSFIGSIQPQKISIIGIPILLITLLGLFTNIEKTFNDIWKVNQSRSYLKRFLALWMVISLGSFLLFVSFAYGIRVHQMMLTYTGIGIRASALEQVSMFLFPTILTFIMFVLIFKFIPNAKILWRGVFVGGLVSALLFELLKNFYTSYTTHSFLYRELYGSITSIPIFFVWIYLVWLVTLIGKVICFVVNRFDDLKKHKDQDGIPIGWQMYLPIFCLLVICQRFLTAGQRDAAPNKEDILKEIILPYDYLENTLNILVKKNWIKPVENRDESIGYIPAVLPQKIDLNDFLDDILFNTDQQNYQSSLEEYILSDNIKSVMIKIKKLHFQLSKNISMNTQ